MSGSSYFGQGCTSTLAPCHFHPVVPQSGDKRNFVCIRSARTGKRVAGDVACAGLSISSDAQASRVVEFAVHQRPFEASFGEMPFGVNSA